MPDELLAPRCLICASEQARAVDIGVHRLWRCGLCDAVYHRPFDSAQAATRFAPEYFRGDASDGYADYLAEGPTLRRQAARYLRRLERVNEGRRLFDVGCAAGFLLREAESRGWQAAGADVSAWATDHARLAGLKVRTEAFDAVDGDAGEAGSRDAVTMLNVLEHCAEPARAVARARRMLAPGGLLCIETWDRDALVARMSGARWHQWSPERVTTWFNRRSLRRLLPETEWSWVSYGSVTRWISLARGLEVLGLPAPAAARGVELPYRLGDLVLLVARKR